jgi:molybdopterin-guanine dinucleotide biosynthesis protein MobB
MDPVDLVLVEGWKREPHPKVEVWRAAAGHPLIAPGDASVRAVAARGAVTAEVPVFDLDDTGAIAAFIAAEVGL